MINSVNRGLSKLTLSLAAALASIGILSTALAPRAGAQTQAEALAIVAPPALEVSAGRETTLSLQITPSGVIPRRAIVLIRGLPASIALSEGRLFESGVWGVPATDLSRLRISANSEASGRSDLDISVVAIDGTILAEAHAPLVISEAAAENGRKDPSENAVYTAASQLESLPPAAAVPLQRLNPEQAQQYASLVKKGDEQLRVGNVSAARLLYRHAAEGGFAPAALALAGTYDEEELGKLRVIGGVHSDPKQAQLWYEKASALGAPEAEKRLQRLGAR